MVDKDVFITEEGLQKIEDEIEYLKTVRRKEVAERIKVALGYGDLSENSEYDEAKNEQAQVEERIAKLEYMARNAKVVKEDDLNEDIVNVGSTVVVKDIETGDEDTYDIVGSAEADPLEGKISNESPIGAGLMGKSVGDVAEIEVPQGKVQLEVLKISI
ncbi:Transcript cleavage factor greA [Aedoeadaptatus ivorii]|uniref:Transcription elongation factor GreA n=1 Tax=Aedoeadaptatus ivorii TaxID=54006 RepID=A0A448V2X2_9FIRM|nr:transcription elongation factor GreA [Peptoniphilus ivorii]MDQ0508740.1 transcription elongation factor GreA [Peptoniphilus ivorii]VEJ36133.1 Transcript cleavage factor greA [Peptoniphilus ivorii]